MGLLNRKPAEPQDKGANPYFGLRQQVLTIDAAQLGLAPSTEHPQVFAGLMEMGMDGGVATLVVMADGTTSMYWSTGGGIIGAGVHEPVKRPSKAFLAALERHGQDMGQDDPAHPLPQSGITHLRARTIAGACLFAAAPGADFGEKRHPLEEAFYAAHAVITAMRQLPSVKNSQISH